MLLPSSGHFLELHLSACLQHPKASFFMTTNKSKVEMNFDSEVSRVESCCMLSSAALSQTHATGSLVFSLRETSVLISPTASVWLHPPQRQSAAYHCTPPPHPPPSLQQEMPKLWAFFSYLNSSCISKSQKMKSCELN